MTDEEFMREYLGVDVSTGGFPCQPFSNAGKQLGEDDERNLWSDTARLIRDVRPRVALLENVASLHRGGQGRHEVTPNRDLYPAGAPGSVSNPLRVRRPRHRLRLRWAQGRDAYGAPLMFVEVARDRWVRVSLDGAAEPPRDEVVPFVLAYRRGLLGSAHVVSTDTLVAQVRDVVMRALPQNPARTAAR